MSFHQVFQSALITLLQASAPVALATTALASPEQDAMVFLESVTMPKQAKICAVRRAGFQAEFDLAWPAWFERSQARIQSGEAFMRVGSEQAGIPFEENIGKATDIAASFLESASPELARENCEYILTKLRSEAKGG